MLQPSCFTLSTQDLVVIEDKKNSLLGRREVKALFKGAAGTMKRIDAAEKIAGELHIDKKNVIPISLVCETGKIDVHASFYVYDDEKEAQKQLPRFRMLRTMPKADRKKILDEEKAARLKAKQAATAEKGAKGGGGAKK
jgi:small subunit ribosomal protein S24e